MPHGAKSMLFADLAPPYSCSAHPAGLILAFSLVLFPFKFKFILVKHSRDKEAPRGRRIVTAARKYGIL